MYFERKAALTPVPVGHIVTADGKVPVNYAPWLGYYYCVFQGITYEAPTIQRLVSRLQKVAEHRLVWQDVIVVQLTKKTEYDKRGGTVVLDVCTTMRYFKCHMAQCFDGSWLQAPWTRRKKKLVGVETDWPKSMTFPHYHDCGGGQYTLVVPWSEEIERLLRVWRIDCVDHIDYIIRKLRSS